ncbi:pyridoxamine 5'-phosphate oxidase family protein [Streptomyces sp. NPDC059708]|uniref:pyridoxamine 5'-phosphate oxidase family protein n=1 Tax=Streptomyces sp. NPDC059708 TaxID=3346916 RepID=UPI00368F8CCC
MNRERVPRPAGRTGRTTPARRMRELDRAEALRLLATVSLGRVVFTHRALPAVRPVNHLVDGEDVERYADLLHPWVERATTAATLHIRPDLVTGFRLEAAAAPARPAGCRPRRESRP